MPSTRPVGSKKMPVISRKEFSRRRRNLMAQMEANSIAILPSAQMVVRSRDTEYKFRQDSDFAYLTGFREPDSVLVLIPGRKHGECIVFCRERDPQRELWDGLREGPEGVCKNFGADDAFPVNDIDEILPGLLEGKERVYYSMGKRAEFDQQLMHWINLLKSNSRAGSQPPGEFLDLDHLLHDMRLYKSVAEQRVMRTAAQISAEAHEHAMRLCRPGLMEYQLEAEYIYRFTIAGAQSTAYSSIVGSGANGCILHYVENDQPIKDGDLVLVDAGCELNGYASDISRTFPANGKFSKEQAALYDLVLDAQLAAIKTIRPGNHWNDPHDAAVQVITQGLCDLGLLDGETNELIEKESYKDFYMHRTGHWLGMDVHDVGDYKVHDEWRVLEPGMAMTVEPGIYVSPGNRKVKPRWRGIGIRIEDDVIVTPGDCDIITSGVVKARKDIEQLMKEGLRKKIGGAKKSQARAQKKPAGKKVSRSGKSSGSVVAKGKLKTRARKKSKAGSAVKSRSRKSGKS